MLAMDGLRQSEWSRHFRVRMTKHSRRPPAGTLERRPLAARRGLLRSVSERGRVLLDATRASSPRGTDSETVDPVM
jgi:hypothetical protein